MKIYAIICPENEGPKLHAVLDFPNLNKAPELAEPAFGMELIMRLLEVHRIDPMTVAGIPMAIDAHFLPASLIIPNNLIGNTLDEKDVRFLNFVIESQGSPLPSN